MIGKDDLGLSLSLNYRANDEEEEIRRHSLQLNLLPPSLSSSSSSSSSQFMNHRWTEALTSVADRNLETYRGGGGGEMRSLLRGIDVNRIPQTTTIDCEEEAGVSSPKSTVSSVSGKRSEREANCGEDNEIERASSRGMSDDEDGDTSRKKLRLSKDQSAILEESFKEHNTLNPKQKLALAKRLNLRPRQVEVWFQNRRARTKLKQTEVDCEFLKRCCENLTEENRRLQKEVQELRALKLSPQFYMHMTPPTTLTMCPSCERVAVSATNNTSVASVAPTSVGAAEVHHTHLMGAHNHHHNHNHNHNHCALSINPWATTPVNNHHRQFDAVHPRS